MLVVVEEFFLRYIITLFHTQAFVKFLLIDNKCYLLYSLFFLLLLQPLARMGATVTGIDALEKNINIARLHAVFISYLQLLCVYVFQLKVTSFLFSKMMFQFNLFWEILPSMHILLQPMWLVHHLLVLQLGHGLGQSRDGMVQIWQEDCLQYQRILFCCIFIPT